MKKLPLKVLLSLSIIFYFIPLNAKANNYQVNFEQVSMTEEYFEHYSLDGNVIASQKLTKADYMDKVKKEKEKQIKKRMVKLKKATGLELTNEEEILLKPQINILAVSEGFGDYHDPIKDLECYTKSSGCTGIATYDEVSYSIHRTIVTLYPNRTNTKSPSGRITTTLIWEVVPKYRKNDLISISWDGDDFSDITSSIKANIINEYTEYIPKYFLGIFLIGYDIEDKVDSFEFTPAKNPKQFKINDNGVIFMGNLQDEWGYGWWEFPPLSNDYKDPNYYAFPVYNDGMINVNKITIKLTSDITYDHGIKIDANKLTNAQFGADYLHFYDYLDIELNSSVDIRLDSVTAGISLSARIKESHDDHRKTYIQFFFTNEIPSC